MSPKKDEKVTEGELVDEQVEVKAEGGKRRVSGGRMFFGLILVVLGSLFILENYFPGLNLRANIIPILIIIFGLTLVFRSL